MKRIATVLLCLTATGGALRGEEAPASPAPPAVALPAPAAPKPLDEAAVRAFERARSGPRPAPTRVVVLERRRDVPLGVRGAGPARQGDARGGTRAFVLEDGRVLVVRGGDVATLGVPGSAPEGRAKRVAVLGDGTVVVLSTSGHLWVAGAGALEPLARRVQAQSQVVGDAVLGDAWLGTEAGAVLRLRPGAGTLDTVWPSGDAPVTALAAEDGFVAVGRGDGLLEAGREGQPLRPIARLASSVTSVALHARGGPWIAATGGGIVVALRAEGPSPAVAWLAARPDLCAVAWAPSPWDPQGDAPPALVLATRRPAPSVEVVPLQPAIEGATLRLAPPAADGEFAAWAVEDVRGVTSMAGGSVLHLVVPHDGAERLVWVGTRPLASPAGR